MSPPRKLRIFVVGVMLAVSGMSAPSLIYAQDTASQQYTAAMELYAHGDVEHAKQKAQLALEIDKNFRPASALLNRIELEQRQGGPATLAPGRTLEKLVVPVEFKDTTLQTALEYIRQQVESLSGGKTKINFVLNLPPDLANKRITLQLGHAPVTEILRYIGDLAGVTFDRQQYAIVVTPAAGAAPQGAAPAASGR